MRTKRNKTGFTLVELLIVIAIMALLAGTLIPAAKALISSFESRAITSQIIGTALQNARAIAMRDGKYAGIRFQNDLRGNQYMILIISDEANLGTYGFKAVAGRKPMKLPGTLGVMDLIVKNQPLNDSTEYTVTSDLMINDNYELNDATSFSIVFAKSGKLATRKVLIRNRDGEYDNPGDASDDYLSDDDIINTLNSVDSGVGKFVQDDYLSSGWYTEDSRNSFVIYEKSKLKSAGSSSRWTNYLRVLNKVYVNPHSGEIILTDEQ